MRFRVKNFMHARQFSALEGLWLRTEVGYLALNRGLLDERRELDNLLHGGGDGHQRPWASLGVDVDVRYVVDVVLVYRRYSHRQSLGLHDTINERLVGSARV